MLFLDTNTLEYEYAPINLLDAKIVIANTNKEGVYLIVNTMKEELSVIKL